MVGVARERCYIDGGSKERDGRGIGVLFQIYEEWYKSASSWTLTNA